MTAALLHHPAPPRKVAPVLDLWRVVSILTDLVTEHSDAIADLQTLARQLDDALETGTLGDIESVRARLEDAQYALIAGAGQVRQLAAIGGAR